MTVSGNIHKKRLLLNRMPSNSVLRLGVGKFMTLHRFVRSYSFMLLWILGPDGSVVEHVHGKEGVPGSSPGLGSMCLLSQMTL